LLYCIVISFAILGGTALKEIFITVKDFYAMAKEFADKGMDYVVVGAKKNKAKKNVLSFAASRDEIDYEISYEYEEK
jgi:hypothetical protein